MMRRMACAAFRAGRSQALGLGAQVLGAAPVIILSIVLSRAEGLAAVADFAVLIGVSVVAFTLGMVGLRSRLVLDRFRTYSEKDYFALRVVASVLMTLGIIASGPVVGAPMMLTLAVALMRAGDAALDLVMALDQVRREDRAHMYGYIIGSSVKLLLLLVFLPLAELTGLVSFYAAFAMASALHVFCAWGLLLNRGEGNAPLFAAGRRLTVMRLLRHSMVFAVAQILCALLTSAPRIALPSIADRDMAGAAAAALSVATLIGMVYYAVWLRWVPRFGKDGIKLDGVAAFIAEMAAAMALILGGVWLLGRPAMALVYGISASYHLDMTLWTLMACAVFFFVMTLANLFKPTRLPWAESAIYTGGLGATWLAFSALPGVSIPVLLMAGTLGMAVLEILSLALLLRRRRQPKEVA